MFLKVATLAALLFAPLYAQAPAKSEAPEKLPEAREIINRHIEAVGGRDAILSHKSMRAVGTITIPGAGMSGPFEVHSASNPSRFVLKSSIEGIGEIAEGFDGTHGWSVNPMTGPALKTGKELEQTKLDADFHSELRDPKQYPEVRTIEKTTFDGRPCYKVSVKRIDGAEDFDFYDVATGLRAGSIMTRQGPMGAMTITNVEGDYKKFGKLTQATTMTQQIMGMEQKMTLTSIEYDKVDPAVFEPPAAIKALIK
jgi:hypothetical protein